MLTAKKILIPMAVCVSSALISLAPADTQPSAAPSEHWAFQPLQTEFAPGATIDCFIDARLERNESELYVSEKADLSLRLRRLSFDILGLPPSMEWMNGILNNPTSEAWTKAVDQALASPRFGETWARHWLDLTRFSETKGHATDIERIHSWKYRDYVIDAFNQDLPYDQFVKEHLAGDLLEEHRGNGRGETNVRPTATGFLFFQEMHFMAVDPVQQRWDEIDAQIEVISKTFLGLSLACARCHDHKIEPLSQEDYYAMAGILSGTELDHIRTGPRGRLEPAIAEKVDELEKNYEQFLQNKIKGRIAAQTKKNSAYFPVSRELGIQSPNDFAKLRELVEPLENLDPSWSFWARSATEANGEDIAIHLRGDYKNQGAIAPRSAPAILRQGPIPELGTNSGRLYLANQLSDPKNPLTARVWVNRIWQRLMGEGIVRTPNDFGLAGERPTHPELLDYLAVQLIRNDWSTKSVIREILMSEVYQRSSRSTKSTILKDPDNHLLARKSPRRLDAEAIRDAMLQIAGSLDLKMHGSSLQPFIPSYATGNKVVTIPKSGALDGQGRRSIYLKVRRNYYTPFLKKFNTADPGKCVGKRETSTAPLQALAMMNSQFSHEIAKRWGRRVARENIPLRPSIEQMFHQALSRKPEIDELDSLVAYASVVESESSRTEGLSEVAHVIFNLAEFILLE
jgi:hypothetical protein